MRRRLITAESQRREALAEYSKMAALIGLPIAGLIFIAAALAIYLPATFPFHDSIVGGARSLAIIAVMGGYVGVTLQLATSYFHSDYPQGLIGVGLAAMVATAVLPIACLFLSLWWAGIPVGSDAADIVARLRWLFAALPAVQAIVWLCAGATGRLFA